MTRTEPNALYSRDACHEPDRTELDIRLPGRVRRVRRRWRSAGESKPGGKGRDPVPRSDCGIAELNLGRGESPHDRHSEEARRRRISTFVNRLRLKKREEKEGICHGMQPNQEHEELQLQLRAMPSQRDLLRVP